MVDSHSLIKRDLRKTNAVYLKAPATARVFNAKAQTCKGAKTKSKGKRQKAKGKNEDGFGASFLHF